MKSSEDSRMGNKEAQALLWTSTERRLWVGTLFMGCMVAYACRTVFPLTIPVMSSELGWSKSESGTVLSAFFWGYAMTQVLGGYISDRIGGATVLLTAAVGWAVLTFWTPRLVYLFSDKSTALAFVVLSRVLVGALQGVHYPGLTSIIAKKVSVEERALSYATATSGGHLGTLFCGSVGSLLLASYGWHIPFYFTGFLGMCWVLFLRYHVMSKQRKKEQLLGAGEEVRSGNTNTPVPWMTLFRKAPFWAVLIAHFCGNYSFFVLLSWLPTYFHEVYPDAKGWVFNVVPWLVALPSSVLSGWISDNLLKRGYSVTFVRKVMNTVSQVGQAFFLVLISYMPSFEGALFCMAGAMACGGFHNSGVLVNPQDIAPKYAGSVFGLMNTAGALPGFIGVYIAGHILEATKSWAAVFNLTSVIIFAGWTIFTCFGTGKKVV